MGHIYSPDEVGTGAVPTASDYETAKKELTHGLQHLVDRNDLLGAVLVGSITYADFEIGSDVDLFAVTESHLGENALRDLTLRITDATHVHFDMKTLTRQAAMSGQHRLLHSYVQTIKDFCGDWVIGVDPLTVVAHRDAWDDIQKELFEDLISRIDSLAKARLHTRPDFSRSHCGLLERIVTLPVYAAIGVVRLKHGGQPSANGVRLSKMETCRLYKGITGGESPGMLFDILRRKQAYRDALKSRQVNNDRYLTILKEIDVAYPLACSVIEDCISYLRMNRLAPQSHTMSP